MKRTSKIHILGRAVILAAVMAAGELGGGLLDGGGGLLVAPAHAVVGRPLTPVSYAGVARRTTRRTVRRGAYYGGAYGGYYGGVRPAYGPYARPMTALPAGCTRVIVGGVARFACAGSTYQPYFDGPNVVYVPVR